MLDTTGHLDPTTIFTASRSYDADGNLKSVTDANGHRTEYVYDAADQLTQVIRADESPLVNEYWPDGQLKAQNDTSGTRTALYDHDSQGRLMSVTDAINRTTTFAYDAAGNLASKADPGGNCPPTGPGTGCTRYSHDPAGQLTAVNYSDGTTPNVQYSYWPSGQRASMIDGTGTTIHNYDSLGRLTSTTDGAGATVTYGYDLRNQLTTLNYPGLGAVTRGWDDAGRIDTITDWAGRVFDYTHDRNGNITAIAYPAGSGNSDTFTYDHAGRMTSSQYKQGGTTLASLSYGRDPNGQLTSISPSGLPGGDHTYGYTALDQLCYDAPSGSGSCDSPPVGGVNYSYDPADNLIATPTAATQRFDGANQLCWTSVANSANSCATAPVDAAVFTHDNRGNRISKTPPSGPATTYSYDQANRLTATSGAVTTNNTYSGDGLRTATTNDSGTNTFTWAHADPLPVALDDGTNAYVYGPDGLPLEHVNKNTGAATYHHHDQLGSTRLLTDNDGTVIGTATYDPYGNATDATGAATPLGYAGQYTDSTGLQYLRARHYDPATGQFLTRDPIVSFTREPYSYGHNNPTNYVDPTGLCGWTDPWNCADDAWDATGGKAASFVNDHTRTVGVCVNQSIGFGPYVSLQGCVAVDRHLNVAVSGSGDVGVSSPTVSASVGPMFSSARHVRDLGGRYSGAGVSVGEGLAAGLDVTRGSDCSGRAVTTFYPSIGAGLNGLPGFEGHGHTGRSGVFGTGGTSCLPRTEC